MTLRVTDANGNPVGCGGATVTITQLSGTGTIGPVVDNGDGTYTATVTAPTTTGSGVFVATLERRPGAKRRGQPGAGHRELRTRASRPFRLRDRRRHADGRQLPSP